MPSRPKVFRSRIQNDPVHTAAEYDRMRGSARERGYDARWDAQSRAFRRDNPLCLGCHAMGLVQAATITDHVIPHRGDMVVFWDRTKWQPSCDWHHSVIKQKLEAMHAQGRASVDDLWLNSDKAIVLSNHLKG